MAILLVLGWHMALPDASHPRAAAWLEFLRRPGWVGVDLFFVLSGYLVAGLLFAEHRLNGSVRAGRFLARRSFKIYPASYLYLWLTFAFGVYETRTPTGHELLMHGLFLQNYVGHSRGV